MSFKSSFTLLEVRSDISLLNIYTNKRSLLGDLIGVVASLICGVCVSRLVGMGLQ